MDKLGTAAYWSTSEALLLSSVRPQPAVMYHFGTDVFLDPSFMGFLFGLEPSLMIAISPNNSYENAGLNPRGLTTSVTSYSLFDLLITRSPTTATAEYAVKYPNSSKKQWAAVKTVSFPMSVPPQLYTPSAASISRKTAKGMTPFGTLLPYAILAKLLVPLISSGIS